MSIRPQSLRAALAIVILVAITDVAHGADEIIRLPHGLVVAVPAGWRRADTTELEKSQNSQTFRNPELMHRVQTSAPMETLIVLAKHPADHIGLNPLILVTRTAIPEKLKNVAPEKLLEAMLAIVSHGFFNVRVEDWVPTTTVSKRKAARASTTYEIHGQSGRVTHARGTFVIMIDGDHFIMFGTSAPAAGEDDTRAVFNKFLAAVKFESAGK